MKPTQNLVLLAWLSLLPVAGKAATSPVAAAPTVRAQGVGWPWIGLQDSSSLPASFDGPTDVRERLERDGRATVLAAADLDEDGVLDLVVGYDLGATGAVAVFRGNVDAIYPHSAQARRRRAQGAEVGSPFLGPARLYPLPQPAHLLVAGDYDGDGHRDLVVAERGGGRLHHLAGDGSGALETRVEMMLDGAVTALETGEIDRRDGMPDLAVAIDGAAGPALLLFQHENGALKGSPRSQALPARATDLLVTRVDGDLSGDVVAAAGRRLVIVFGRRGSLEPGSPPPPATSRLFDFELLAVERGDFDPERKGDETAVLGDDGVLRILSPHPAGGKGSAAAVAEILKTGVAERRLQPLGRVTRTMAVMPARHRPATRAAPPSHLVVARLSSRRGDAALGFGGDAPGIGLMTTTHASDAIHPPDRGSASSMAGPLDPDAGEPRAALHLSSQAPVRSALPLRLTPHALDSLVVLTEGSLVPVVMKSVAVGTFTVDSSGNESDLNVGDNICVTVANTCTLRAAIQEANAIAGLHQIEFDLPVAPPFDPSIGPTTQLPKISDAVSILGSSQPTGTVRLLGGALAVGSGLRIAGDGSKVEGLVIAAFPNLGLDIEAMNCVVEGNVLGKPSPGSFIAGNGDAGVSVFGRNNTIGGTTPQARNQISGNADRGIYLLRSSPLGGSDNVVQGNYIGTDSSGTSALGNRIGIEVRCGGVPGDGGHLIGGTAAGAGNVIAASTEDGLRLECVDDNLVQGNLIGTDVSGTSALGNGRGIWIQDQSADNTIGGNHSAANVISGNGTGILVESSSNVISANKIGIALAGEAPLGNGGVGVQIEEAGNTVRLNRIANGGGGGVVNPTAARNELSRNAFWNNVGLGIDLLDDSVTFNDGETTGDDVQDFPVLSSVSVSGGTTSVTWSLRSAVNTTFEIDFYRSLSCDPSGFGEARAGVGTLSDQVTNSAGVVGGTADFAIELPPGQYVTATATQISVLGNKTSELSFCRGRDDLACPHPDDITIDSDIVAGDHTIEACSSITASAAVRGASTSAAFKAQTVALGEGFRVEQGATFSAGLP